MADDATMPPLHFRLEAIRDDLSDMCDGLKEVEQSRYLITADALAIQRVRQAMEMLIQRVWNERDAALAGGVH